MNGGNAMHESVMGSSKRVKGGRWFGFLWGKIKREGGQAAPYRHTKQGRRPAPH